MNAKVTTYGGETMFDVRPPRPAHIDGIRTAQHWVLTVDGTFIADTSVPQTADLFRKIAERCEDECR